MTVSKQIIKLLRKERGWSQERLSIISGLSERTIQRIEKSGDCSLDSKLALASVFEVPPNDIEDKVASQLIFEESTYDWGTALGAISLLLIVTVVFSMLTRTYGVWEISCLLIVDGLAIVLLSASHGFKEAIRFFSNTLSVVKKVSRAADYNATIIQANLVIQNVYIIGFVAMLVYLLTTIVHFPDKSEDIKFILVEAFTPALYAILLSEFWIRPFKHKIEKQMTELLGKTPEFSKQ